MRRSPLVTGLALMIAACSSAPVEPRSESHRDGASPEAGTTTTRPVTAPEIAAERTVRGIAESARSRSGATVLVMSPDTGALQPAGEICLSLPAGRGHGRAGLAELAIESLVAVREGNGASLRSTIRELGGSLETDTGPERSWVYIRVPPAAWEAGLEALARALTEPATTRAQLERVRADVLVELARSLSGERSDRVVVERLVGGMGGPADVVQALGDRDPAEVLLFQRRYFRPETSVLAVAVPNDEARGIAETATMALDGWSAASLRAVPPARAELGRAIHWVPGDSPCRAVLLFGLPDPLEEQAAGHWVLQECLTMAGLGGRLERGLIDAGASRVFGSEILSSGTRDWLALTTAVEPEQVRSLWHVAGAARASLATVAPSDSEQTLGRRRARLGLLSQRRTPFRRLQLAMRQVVEAKARDPLKSHLEQLADPDHDLTPARASWLRLPFAMVVVGGEPPEAAPGEAEEIVQHAPAESRAVSEFVSPDPLAGIEEARPHLQRALQAMGGPHKIGEVVGYRQVAELQVAGGPAAVERIELEGFSLERERIVLGTKVRTVIANGRGTESVGDTESELEPLRMVELMLEANRHPLMLLAEHLRGRLSLRLVSVRRLDDTDVAVLEAVNSPYPRLRLHVDVRSGLPRIVETWRKDGEGPLYLREVYSDFRETGGLRIPFRRVTDIDDEGGQLKTVVSEFQPIRR